MAFRLAQFTNRLGGEGGKKVTCLVHMNDGSGKHSCLQSFKLHFTRVKGQLQKATYSTIGN